MDSNVILALIADLYAQIGRLAQENAALREAAEKSTD